MSVVLISAYPDREFHRQGLEAGAVAFLDKKDLDVVTLAQVIGDLYSLEELSTCGNQNV
jgi:CheY-like chemotaxis protein